MTLDLNGKFLDGMTRELGLQSPRHGSPINLSGRRQRSKRGADGEAYALRVIFVHRRHQSSRHALDALDVY